MFKDFSKKQRRVRGAFLALAVVGYSGMGVAETPATDDKLANCTKLTSDTVRLACYDALAGYAAPEKPVTQTTGPGWRLSESKDAFTNKDTSHVFIDSTPSTRKGSDAPVALVVRCTGDGGNEVFVLADGYIGGRNDRIPVRYKFGEDAPITERWHESTSGTSAFLPRGFQDFRNGMTSHNKVIFEMTDFRGSTNLATFEGLRGNKDALQFVLDGCPTQ